MPNENLFNIVIAAIVAVPFLATLLFFLLYFFTSKLSTPRYTFGQIVIVTYGFHRNRIGSLQKFDSSSGIYTVSFEGSERAFIHETRLEPILKEKAEHDE